MGSDAFWNVVVTFGTAYPPASGQGTATSPVLVLQITATSSGFANLHPLIVTFGSDGYGPTAGVFNSLLSGHTIAGTGQSMTFNTFYRTDNSLIPNPPTTALTSSGASLTGPTLYNGLWTSGAVNLAGPYSLMEVITILAPQGGAGYVLDGSLTVSTAEVDIGLRANDGTGIIKIAAEPGTPTSPVRINKNGTNYGVLLVDPSAANASRIRIQTSAGVKAWEKLP